MESKEAAKQFIQPCAARSLKAYLTSVAIIAGLSVGLLPAPTALAHEGGTDPNSPCANEGPYGVPGLDLPPDQIGQWSSPQSFPIQGTHSTLLHTGKVMLFHAGVSGRRPTKDRPPMLWDPIDHTFEFTTEPNHGNDMFCSGHATLADGRVVVIGGTVDNTNHLGSKEVHAYDPETATWEQLADLKQARWYPTLTTLSDGRLLAMAGTRSVSSRARIPEIYNPETDSWHQLKTASLSTEAYPFNFVLPNGNLLYAAGRGPNGWTQELDLTTETWRRVAHVNQEGLNGGSAAMYLPGKIVKIGGRPEGASNAEREGVEVFDFNEPNPAWREVAPMEYDRRLSDLVLLPDGTSLAVGGSKIGLNTHECAVHAAELWSPVTESWTTMASLENPRIYHSTTVLLPDGRVLASSGENHEGAENNGEVFSPPYLFKGPRPTIDAAPTSVGYGTQFTIETPDSADIASVVLMRPGSVTHNFDQNQRYVPLNFNQSAGALVATAPSSGNQAPPGYYMLFIVNADGVPAVAKFVQVSGGGGDGGSNASPTITIVGPAANSSSLFGETVIFTGTAADPEDGNLDADIQWTSDRNGFLGLGATIETSELLAGPHVIRARVADNVGSSANTTINITIEFPEGGTSSTLSNVGDSIARIKKAGLPHGQLSYLPVRKNQIGYLQFDTNNLSGIPTSATLKLHVTQLPASGSLEVHAVQNAWSESSLTWNNRPAIASTASTSVAINSAALDTVIDVDVTALVQNWAANPSQNFGLALVSGNRLSVQIASREADMAPVIEMASVLLPTIGLLAPKNGQEFVFGQTINFMGEAQDAEGGDLSQTLVWTSDIDGEFGNGSTVTTAALSSGFHQITAQVSNADGLTAAVGIDIDITAPADMEFTAILTPNEVITGSNAQGSARANLLLNAARTGLNYRIEFDSPLYLSSDVTSETGANAITAIHAHDAVPWQSGGHVLNIFGIPAEDDAEMTVDFANGIITGRWDDSDASGDPLSPATTKKLSDTITQLLDGGLYIAAHSPGQGGGPAVRGQIVRSGAIEIEVEASGDTYVNSKRPYDKTGATGSLSVNRRRTGLIDFDITQLDGTIDVATLHLPVRDVKLAGTLELLPVLEGWEELSVDYTTLPVLNSTPIGSLEITAANRGATVELEITDLVRSWVANPESFFGLALQSSRGLSVVLENREAGDGPHIDVTIRPSY